MINPPIPDGYEHDRTECKQNSDYEWIITVYYKGNDNARNPGE